MHKENFYKENFLYHAIACIIFADDMTEYERVDFDTFFEDLKDNDEGFFEKWKSEADVWEKANSEAFSTLLDSIKIYNEKYAKELNGKPILSLRAK